MTSSVAEDFVRRRFGDRMGELVALGAGEWSRAFATMLDGAEVVVRFGLYGEDFAKDALVGERAPTSLHVPRMIEHGPANGVFYAVSERRHGTFLDHLDDAGMRAVLPGLLAVLDTIPTVHVDGADVLAGDYSWSEALLDIDSERPRLAGWREKLAGHDGGSATFTRALAVLTELAPQLPDRRELIHMDLLNRNVLVESERITAVFDWGNALRGDGLYDAAWLLWWWPWLPAFAGIDIRAELDAHWAAHGGTPADLELRLLACQLHIGLDHLSFYAWSGEADHLRRNASQLRVLMRSAG